MAQAMPFGEVLEAVAQLSSDEQEALVSILQRRLAEQGRKRVATEIQEARQEFAAGRCRSVTVDELIREILDDERRQQGARAVALRNAAGRWETQL